MACKKDISQQTELLNQISKVSDAIRRKYKILKVGRDSSEQAANEIFKPIVTPLQTLVENSKNIKYETKQEDSESFNIKKKSEAASSYTAFKTVFDNASQDQIENPSEEFQSPSKSLTTNQNFDNQMIMSPGFASTPLKDHDSLSRYLTTLNRKNPKGFDIRFGIRKKGSQLFLGDSPVQFEDDNVIIKNQTYHLSPGLKELMFKSAPDDNLIHPNDLQIYKSLIILTNTHRKHYEAERSLYRDKTIKYTKYIAPMFQMQANEIEGEGLPNFMSASRKRKNVDYIYWDDPNELIDRLRLLMASQVAGNSSHSNEIISIIEELREAQIIY